MKSAARWVTSSTDCDLVSLRVLTTGNRIEQRGGRRACSPGARVAWGAGGRRPRGNAVYLNETGLAALYDLCVMTVPFLGNRAARATTVNAPLLYPDTTRTPDRAEDDLPHLLTGARTLHS